jgi:hypothetical protein
MNTFSILVICLSIFLFFSIAILIRNEQVLRFRLNLIELHFNWVSKNDFDGEYVTEFMKRIPSYNKMLYSFKKLTLENWLSTEDINKLTN